MQNDEKPGNRDKRKPGNREQRLAEALRANLRRRRDQAKRRAAAHPVETDSVDGAEPAVKPPQSPATSGDEM